MNQHQEPVHLNYCGRLDAIDPKQRIVFTLFLFSLGFATSRKIYQKKSREIWDKQTLHLGHLLQVPTQLTGVSCTPWIPLGHCRVRLHVSHVSQRHNNFYTSCNHLQSSAIRLHQPECLPHKEFPCGSISDHFSRSLKSISVFLTALMRPNILAAFSPVRCHRCSISTRCP